MHNARAREIYTHIHTEEEEVRRNIRDGKQRLCTYERASTCASYACWWCVYESVRERDGRVT